MNLHLNAHEALTLACLLKTINEGSEPDESEKEMALTVYQKIEYQINHAYDEAQRLTIEYRAKLTQAD